MINLHFLNFGIYKFFFSYNPHKLVFTWIKIAKNENLLGQGKGAKNLTMTKIEKTQTYMD